MRVLIVDDDRHLVETVRRGLALRGHTALTARRAEAGGWLFGARTLEYDVLLLDLGTADRVGLGLARAGRQAGKAVVALSGLETSAEVHRLDADGVRLVRRPFDAGRLDAALTAALGPAATDAERPLKSPP